MTKLNGTMIDLYARAVSALLRVRDDEGSQGLEAAGAALAAALIVGALLGGAGTVASAVQAAMARAAAALGG